MTVHIHWYYYYYFYYYYYYYYYYLKYLALKAGQLRNVCRPGYFNPGSQAALRRMLSDWARVEGNTLGRCEQDEDDVKKDQ